MFVKKFLIIILIFLLVGIISCSGNSESNNPINAPIITGNSNLDTDRSNNSNHYLLYDSLIRIDPTDPENIRYEIVPLRISNIHLNILKLLEESPCTDCFQIVGLNIPEPGILNVDIEITHPFTDPDLTIFDVRGIIMFNGSHVYPVTGATISDSTLGDGELLNADGYTSLYNASTLGTAPGPYTGYYKGNFATPTMPNATVNGYKRHIFIDPTNARNALYAGESVISSYQMKMPAGPFVLGYAVDANWAPPLQSPVDNPSEDFGTNANSPEPWKLEVSEIQSGGGLTSGGGETTIAVDVFDWDGKSTYGSPRIECPELFNTPAFASWIIDGPDYSRFEAQVTNSNLAIAGNYRMLIRVEANENDPDNKPWLDLTAYQLLTVEVTGGQPGDFDPIAIADANPNPQYLGNPVTFDGSASYDPDGGSIVKYEWQWESGAEFLEGTASQDYTYSNPGTFDVQLRVTDDDGQIDTLDQPLIITIYENPGDAIAQTWGGTAVDVVEDMAMDGSGDIFIVGEFNYTADFDPGPDVHELSPVGSEDAYISKFSSDGIWQWTKTISGIGTEKGTCVQIDSSGGFVVCGSFTGKADFDPGTGHEYRYSSGYSDAYVARFDPAGNFSWVATWGGGAADWATRIAVDGQGRINVTGSFSGTVDLNPGDGIDNHTSINVDVFLIQLNSDGDYNWGYNWGTFDSINTTAIAVTSSERIYVLGQFEKTVDFDPGELTENHISHGGMDVYLAKYSSGGEYLGTLTWGGAGKDIANDVNVNSGDYAFVAGDFQGTVDFDPGDGTSFRTADGTESDAYLSSFDSGTALFWVRSWGGLGDDAGYGVWAAPTGYIYTVGTFSDTTDFDPTGGTDYRTSTGQTDSFIARYNSNGDYTCVKMWGGVSIDQPVNVIYYDTTRVWISGIFRNNADFDPGSGEEWHASAGNIDCFLTKLPEGCD